MFKELKHWLHSKNIPYNPAGNGQRERYNNKIWKAVCLACKSKDLDALALHSIQSLLYTSTNCTPHERRFAFQRRSSTGPSMPSWLVPRSILLKRHARKSKFGPFDDQVQLLNANPNYHLLNTLMVVKSVFTT